MPSALGVFVPVIQVKFCEELFCGMREQKTRAQSTCEERNSFIGLIFRKGRNLMSLQPGCVAPYAASFLKLQKMKFWRVLNGVLWSTVIHFIF